MYNNWHMKQSPLYKDNKLIMTKKSVGLQIKT